MAQTQTINNSIIPTFEFADGETVNVTLSSVQTDGNALRNVKANALTINQHIGEFSDIYISSAGAAVVSISAISSVLQTTTRLYDATTYESE